MTTLHVFSNRHIKSKVDGINKGDYVYLENSLSRKRWSLYFRANGIDESELNLTYITEEDYFSMTKKFDNIVGNPPYQDNSGSEFGRSFGQNKIYNAIAKKSLSLLTDDGTMSFVTPTAVLKKSKRFSVVGESGLRLVDFNADDHFDVGVNICSWFVDKTYNGDVLVKHCAGSYQQKPGKVIHNLSVVDEHFAKIYDAFKEVTSTPDKRMFIENNVGPDRSKIKDKEHPYPLYKIDADRDYTVSLYTGRNPASTGKKKIVISRTKALNDETIVQSDLDFDVAHVFIDIKNKKEFINIKSFILSESFLEHSKNWKMVDGYGFNNALVYLPPFDKTKSWTNKEVKEFIESFIK